MPFRFVIIGLLCWPFLANAADLGAKGEVIVSAEVAEVPLVPRATIIRDPDNRMTAAELASAQLAEGVAEGSRFASFGFSSATYWFSVALNNTGSAPLQRLLVLEPTWLDDVQVTLLQDNVSIQTVKGGDLLPFDQRAVPHRYINFNLSLPAGASQLLVRVQSRDPIDVGMTLWERSAFFESDARESKYWGLVYGVLGALFLYNLFLFFAVREISYAAYAAYLLSYLCVHATIHGDSYRVLWPDSPVWNNWALSTFIYLDIFSGLLFAMLFLELRTRLYQAYRWALVLAVLIPASAVATALFGGYALHIASATAWVVLFGPFVVLLGIWSLRQGNRAARFFLLGMTCGFIGSLITALTASGVIPFSFFSYRAVDFGMVIDAILLSFALADRIALLHREKDMAQAGLKANDERWRLALESAGEGAWDWNLRSNEVLFSRHWREMLGYFEHEISNNFDAWRNLVHPLDQARALNNLQAYLSGAIKAYRNEFRMLCKDGSWKWILAQGAVVERNGKGKPLRMIGTHIDISEPKRMESMVSRMNEHLEERVAERTRELQQAKAMAESANLSKGRFLAAAGHDLRQPLAAANLFIDALKSIDSTSQQAEIIQRLDQAMATFNGLLDALLNVSRLDAGVIKPEYASIKVTELFCWLEESFEPLASKNKIGFKLHFPLREALVVRSDVGLLKSVLMNLVSNAIKFTPKGGILVSARRRGSEVLFQVWDTGIGIPQENIRQIFDEFYQVDNPQRDRSRGLGLGLSIVKRALTLLGSEITCRSKSGNGAVFGFSLPLVSASAMQQDAALAALEDVPDESFTREKRFVVVEDDVLVAQAMTSWLEGMGGRVTCFHSAQDALEHAHIGHADYYLADYMLGGTLNGIQFLNQLRQKLGRPVNAVVMTGDTSPTFVHEAAACDWPVLYKPVDTCRLISSLRAQEVRSRV